jgi:hypothetical protein
MLTWQNTLQDKCKMLGISFKQAMEQTDSSGMMEGLYIKQEDDLKVVNRYKYVRHEFLQRILESGSHEELMQQKGLYYKLYRTQSELLKKV